MACFLVCACPFTPSWRILRCCPPRVLGGAGAGRACSLLGRSPSLLSALALGCQFPGHLPFPAGLPQELCVPGFGRIHWLSSPFPSRPFRVPSPDCVRCSSLILGPFWAQFCSVYHCPFSAALKCPSLPLSPQSLCGVGLVFSRRPLEACRILPPGTAPGVGHVWFPCVFADFMVVCILSVFYRGPVFKVFADFVTVLLPLCVLAFWLPDLRAPSSTAKGRTSAACAGRPSLSRWAAREGPLCLFCLFTFEGE